MVTDDKKVSDFARVNRLAQELYEAYHYGDSVTAPHRIHPGSFVPWDQQRDRLRWINVARTVEKKLF